MNDDMNRRIIALRRDLHQHPELSWQETRTAAKVCQVLDELRIEHRSGVAGTGIVAEIPGRIDGPRVALRADLDALPIHEETGLPFASQNEGVMHACGHDGHTSILVGAAMHLVQGDAPPAPVRLIFQPAEETGAGAKAMIEAGVLDGVAMVFGGHLDRHFPTGTIAVTDGAVNASSDTFSVEITGKGGHAARPHETVDAVVVGSLLVMALQTIVSREVNPAHPSVVTIGSFEAGTAANVIASRAMLRGSIRAQDEEVRRHLHASIRRIAHSIAQLHGAAIEVELNEGTPVLINAPEWTAPARQAAAEVVGESNVRKLIVANMGGEDFSYYLTERPGCYVRFGGHSVGTEAFPAHSSRFDFDEAALAIGASYFHRLAFRAGQIISDGQAASSAQHDQ
jgi:hippurate hydrolase